MIRSCLRLAAQSVNLQPLQEKSYHGCSSNSATSNLFISPLSLYGLLSAITRLYSGCNSTVSLDLREFIDPAWLADG